MELHFAETTIRPSSTQLFSLKLFFYPKADPSLSKAPTQQSLVLTLLLLALHLAPKQLNLAIA